MRACVSFAIALGSLLCCQAGAEAQSYPTRPIRIIVPASPGGANDMIARAVGQRLAKAWGQPVIIENRPEANGQNAPSLIAKAAPDGHTLLSAAERTFAVNPYLYSKLPYEPADFLPVSGLARIHQVLVVHPSLAVGDLRELIVAAKSAPKTLSYSTIGPGSAPHLNMELLQRMAGIELMPVHYRGGGAALNDVIGGHVQMAFISAGLMLQPWKTGQLKVMGVANQTRLTELPEIATIAESGLAGFEAFSWFGLFAPVATPSDVISKLNDEVQRILADKPFAEQFLEPNFYQPIGGSPHQFSRFVESEARKWSQVVNQAKSSLR